jgi:lysophospholipase L1-like esterase
MNTFVTRILVLSAVLFSAAFAAADAGRSYLALGDSISTGYQPTGMHLADGKFASILAARLGLDLNNQAVDGNTAAGINSQLRNGALDSAIASASLITVTVGGNDLMAALYSAVAAAYNVSHASAPITAADVPSILSDSSDSRRSAVLMSAFSVVSGGDFTETPSFTETLASFTVNFTNAVAYIRARNPSAPMVIETQYNPYQWMGSGFVQTPLSNTSDSGVRELNAVIAAPVNGAGTMYRVADVYAAFAASSTNLCCATADLSSLDFHPNPTGHAVIAATMLDTLCFVSSVTVNGAGLSLVGGGADATAWGYDGTNLVLAGMGTYAINGSNGSRAVSIRSAADCTVVSSNLTIDVSAFAGLPALDAGGRKVTISGGTFVLAGGSGSADIAGAVDITGGSVRLLNGTFTAAPSNGTERVYCVTASGFAPNAPLAVSGLPAAYGVANISADAGGRIYLWLPDGPHAFAAAGALKAATVAGASAAATDAALAIIGYDSATGALSWSPTALDVSALTTLYSTNLTDAASWSVVKPEGAKAVFMRLKVK